MDMERFSELVQLGLEKGQEQLATTVRQLVYKVAPDLFDLMNFEDDKGFLNPSLFAWFTAETNCIPFEQIMFGIIAEDVRPSHVNIITDRNGRADLPGLGFIETTLPHTKLRLQFDKKNDQFTVKVRSDWVKVTFNKHHKVPQHLLIIHNHIPAVYERFFSTFSDDVNIKGSLLNSLQDVIKQALDLMQKVDPEIYRWITAATQSILLYNAELPNSFAALSAHGAAFCNCNEESDHIFFLDDLAHQCGHIIFNALTLNKEAYLAVDPDTPLKSIINKDDESRVLYSAFHGLFTYTLITRVLHCVLRSESSDSLYSHHALGRMAFYLDKFGKDLENLEYMHLFTKKGQEFYEIFQHIYLSTHGEYRDRVKQLDLENQPYVFSRSLFEATNPLSRNVLNRNSMSTDVISS